MRIVISNYSKNDRFFLLKSINELKKIIRVNYRAEINIIDSLDNIIQWAGYTTLDSPEGKRTIIIASQEIIEALNITLMHRSIIYINIEDKVEDIVISIAKFLSCNILERGSTHKEVITLSEREAETIYEMYTQNAKLTKNKQNIKYRIMKKLNVRNHFQLFIWWKLTDLMPQSQLKNIVLIK